MIRIRSARMSFQGFHGSPERASAISQHALRELGEQAPPVGQASAPRRRVQLTVRVARGASDATIATQVAGAVHAHLGDRRGRGTGT